MCRVLLTASAVSVLQKLRSEIGKTARDALRELAPETIFRQGAAGWRLARIQNPYRFAGYRIFSEAHPGPKKSLVIWAIGPSEGIYLETFGPVSGSPDNNQMHGKETDLVGAHSRALAWFTLGKRRLGYSLVKRKLEKKVDWIFLQLKPIVKAPGDLGPEGAIWVGGQNWGLGSL